MWMVKEATLFQARVQPARSLIVGWVCPVTAIFNFLYYAATNAGTPVVPSSFKDVAPFFALCDQ